MVKSQLGKKVLEISEGVFASLTDLVLTYLIFSYESIVDPRVGRSLPYTFAKVDSRLEEINYQSLKRAVKHAREKGWIKESLKPTPEGRRRLKDIFPETNYSNHWDGNWHLVNFDIPERLRFKRNILRANLKRLNFGKLQNSIWISAYNFLGEIKEVVNNLGIGSYVIFSISDKVGQEESKILAARIWKISELQKEYRDFVIKSGREGKDFFKSLFRYQSIVINDPCLPRELLPEDWAGEKAKKLYLDFTKNLHRRKN